MLEDIEKVIDKLKIYDRCLIDHKADDYYYIYLEAGSKIIEIDLISLDNRSWDGFIYITDEYNKDTLNVLEFDNIEELTNILKDIDINKYN